MIPFLTNLYRKLYSRDTITILLFLLLFILFKSQLDLFVLKYIAPILSTIKSELHIDLIWFLALILITTPTFIHYREYVISKRLFAQLWIACIIYSYYRFIESPWEFTRLHLLSSIAYSDLLFFATACYSVLIIPKKNKKVVTESLLFEDKPLNPSEKDLLGYNIYAEELADKITKSHFSQSFAIGINGNWGMGKTSFINLLKQYLTHESIIEINFNPWGCNSSSAIIQDFFNLFSNELSKYHSKLPYLTNQYIEKLVQLKPNSITKGIGVIGSFFKKDFTIEQISFEMNEAIKKLNKRIIVYIDDLDRLESNEIVEILRLIRKTANFHDMIFVVTYDRNYVVNSLSKHTSYGEDEFLEKIFQFELTLPAFRKDILVQQLIDNLTIHCPKTFNSEILSEIDRNKHIEPFYLDIWLDSMRDVTRLTNALILNYTKLSGEVVFEEFLQLELLRLKYPSVYELLHKNRSIFLEGKSTSYYSHTYQLVLKMEKSDSKNNEKHQSSYLRTYLNQNHSKLSVPQTALDKITSLLEELFPKETDFAYKKDSTLSITSPSKFYRYFTYSLPVGHLSELEFSKFRALPLQEFLNQITIWVNKGMAQEIKNKFYEIDIFDNQEDFEKIILSIFHLANLPSKEPNHWGKYLINFDNENLLRKLKNYNSSITERYYNFKGGKEKFEQFLKTIFTKATFPYVFESYCLGKMNSESQQDIYPLSLKERVDISINYLRDFCNKTDKFDIHSWYLFHGTKYKEWVSNGGGSLTGTEKTPQEAKEIMQSYLLDKDLNGTLSSIIDPHRFGEKGFAVSSIITQIFDSWENFETALNKKKDSKNKALTEFLQFYKVFEKEGNNKYVEFDFKHLNPRQYN